MAVVDKVEQAIDELAIWGPQLGRPLVDRIHGSKIHNLEELRPRGGGASEVRLLFVFDAAREAIILPIPPSIATVSSGPAPRVVTRCDILVPMKFH
jgi:hypothetical protein